METATSLAALTGQTDRLTAFHASLAAMAWATGNETIEAEFWDEVFDALVLRAEAEVGMAQATISGLAPKALLKILKTVFAGIDYRFGRRFVARRPFQGLANQRANCLFDQLAWLAEQADTATIMTTVHCPRRWVMLREAEDQHLTVLEAVGHPPPMSISVTAIKAKSAIVIERCRDHDD